MIRTKPDAPRPDLGNVEPAPIGRADPPGGRALNGSFRLAQAASGSRRVGQEAGARSTVAAGNLNSLVLPSFTSAQRRGSCSDGADHPLACRSDFCNKEPIRQIACSMSARFVDRRPAISLSAYTAASALYAFRRSSLSHSTLCCKSC